MTAQQKLINYVGLSKQTAKGSGATTPATFGHGVRSGKVFNAEVTQDYEQQTLNGGAFDRFSPGVNRTNIQPGANYTTAVWIRTIGAYLLAALGTDTPSGVGPYTHVITPAQILNYWTLFSRYGAAEYEKTVDCKLNSLEIGWDETGAMELVAEWLGCTPTFGAGGAWTATAKEEDAQWLSPVGGTLQISVATGTPAAAQVKAFRMSINNNLDPVWLSSSVLPNDLIEGEQVIEGTVTLVADDFTDWRKALTGTGAGTSVQATPVYGSFSMLTQLDANNQVTLAGGAKTAFLADMPDGDPAGGKMELELAFTVNRIDASTAPFTATVKNSTATY